MVPVALITAADGVCHLTSAALIIGRQRRRSIYPDRGRADRERTNKNNNGDREIGQVQLAMVAGERDWLQRWAEIARVSVRQMLDGHGRQPRPLGWSFMGRWQACVACRDGCPWRGGGGA